MKAVTIEDIDGYLDAIYDAHNQYYGAIQNIQKMTNNAKNFPIEQLKLEQAKLLEAHELLRANLQFALVDMERLNNDTSTTSKE